MTDDQARNVSRRSFLKTGVTTTAAAAAAAASLPLAAAGEPPESTKPTAPSDGAMARRTLGRTGAKVTILNVGSARSFDDRLLNAAYSGGVRYIDTAEVYSNGKSELAVGKWLKKHDRRKDFFIVTKHSAATPEDWVANVDKRLEALQTDYIDLYFNHGLGGGFRGGGNESDRDIPKLKDWAQAADRLKKSGKVRFVGFSTHTEISLRIDLLNNAAAGGWVDAIMVATDPQLMHDNADFNRALETCHKAGVGLICMKEMRGAVNAPKFMPEFEEKGLTSHQAVLHAIWNDGRFASICSNMPTLKIVEENTHAARNVQTLSAEEHAAVIDIYRRYAMNYCNGCNGECQTAGNTRAALGDIVRYLAYHECDGNGEEARRLFAELTPEERDWSGADLAAASKACVSKLDFARLLDRAQEKLA